MNKILAAAAVLVVLLLGAAVVTLLLPADEPDGALIGGGFEVVGSESAPQVVSDSPEQPAPEVPDTTMREEEVEFEQAERLTDGREGELDEARGRVRKIMQNVR
jgi:hypothetical protein